MVASQCRSDRLASLDSYVVSVAAEPHPQLRELAGAASRRRLRAAAKPAACVALIAVFVACGSSVDNTALLDDNSNHVPAEVTVQGSVAQLARDSNGPDGPHENFYVDVAGLRIHVVHNLDLAPRVPVKVGDTVLIHGQFEPDPGDPVIHYTHHATDRHEGGYIQLNGETYQ